MSDFPVIVSCAAAKADLPDALDSLQSRRGDLEAQLAEHGAILFRGFPLFSAEDFDAFVRSFGSPNFPYDESLSNAVRVNRTERVFTANEAPATATIRLHHEMAQTPLHPSQLFFFCEQPAARGGATPLCRSDRLLEALASRRPDFVADCEEHGLLYTLVMPPEEDANSGQGRSWRSTFGVSERGAAEERMRRLGYSWEWLADGCLRATTPVLPAVWEIGPNRKSFFNQLIASLAWEDRRKDTAPTVTLGNGRPIDSAAATLAGELAEELAVDLAWERGDVAWVDNRVVMHGRRSFEGKRTVLASLVA